MKAKNIKTIKDLVRHVDRKYWHGHHDGPRGLGSAMNAYLFVEWVGPQSTPYTALEEDTIHSYLSHRQNVFGNKPATVNRHAAAISKLVKVAERLGLIDEAPEIPYRRETGNARTEVFTPEQEQEILDNTPCFSYWNLFKFLSGTGMRLGEALSLQWEDCDFSNRLIHIKPENTKNKKPRTIGMSYLVYNSLNNQRNWSGHYTGPFVGTVSPHTLRVHWENLRKNKLDWMDERHVIHTFRHTCASRLVQQGASLDMVGRWLGHSDPKQTMRYAKYAPKNFQDMAALLDSYGTP